MKSISVRLVGGLGNQLFQFSYAYSIMKKLNFDQILLDTRFMSKYRESWGYLLDIVLDSNKIVSFVHTQSSDLHKVRAAHLSRFAPMIGAKLGLISDANCEHFKQCRFNKIYLDGYFERRDFLQEDVLLLKNLLRDDLLIKLPKSAVVVNIRGGEFVRLGISSKKDLSAYQRCLEQINRTIANPEIHVITDDLDYAKKIAVGFGPKLIFHEPNPFENFRMLYSAQHKIITKSTFAQWATMLSPSTGHVYKI